MVKPTRPPANAFVAAVRKLYNPIGFSKGYNFVLFFIFAGALMGFTLARFQYLDYYGVFCGEPSIGECYFYTRGVAEVGLIIHLAGILPASFLAVFQFVPAIRHKWILVHRVNGYVILMLSIVSTVGAFMSARNAFGRGLEVQLAVGVIGIMFIVSMVLAYINIKRLQIEQHRAWMLRGWFYVRPPSSRHGVIFPLTYSGRLHHHPPTHPDHHGHHHQRHRRVLGRSPVRAGRLHNRRERNARRLSGLRGVLLGRRFL